MMIADHRSQGWVQVGFYRSSSLSGVRWFSQAVRRTGEFPETWISPYSVNAELGNRHAFRVLWDPACFSGQGSSYACEKSTIDSSVVALSSFNPFAYWQTPFLPMFFGETKNYQSDITGSDSTRTTYTGVGAQRYNSPSMTRLGGDSAPAWASPAPRTRSNR